MVDDKQFIIRPSSQNVDVFPNERQRELALPCG
jgi:hypothetical protein